MGEWNVRVTAKPAERREVSCVVTWDDGSSYEVGHYVNSYHDIRQTAAGLVDFGQTTMRSFCELMKDPSGRRVG